MKYYIMKHFKINLFAVIVQVLMSGIQVGLNLVLIWSMQALIDRDAKTCLTWLAIDVIGWMVVLLLDAFKGFLANNAIRRMNNDVRADMTNSLLAKSYNEYHEQDSGEYISHFTNDIKQIEESAWNPFFSCIDSVAQILFSIVALFTMHWSLLVASLIAAAIIIFAPGLLGNKMQALGAKSMEEQAKATDSLKNIFMGYDVFRSFGKELLLKKKSSEQSARIENAKFNLNFKQNLYGDAIAFFSVICQCSVSILIMILSIKGIIIQSAIMGGGNICASIYNNLGQLGGYKMRFEAAKPIFKAIKHGDELAVDSNEAKQLPELSSKIEFKDVNFAYGDKPVLSNLNLTFEAGKKYAIVGASGSGKSTTLKLLLGWLTDYTGEILYDGVNVKDYSPEQLQKRMSYIEQNVFLFNTTIKENITLEDNFTEAELDKACDNSALSGDLGKLDDGINTEVGDQGSNISGGQKQRVAIARALIHNRNILLVDEGTSALDKTNAEIVENNLLKNKDLTLILISHHLSDERMKLFDKVYTI